MTSLTITSQEALSHISWIKFHPYLTVAIIVAAIVLFMIISTYHDELKAILTGSSEITITPRKVMSEIFFTAVAYVVAYIIIGLIFSAVYVSTPLGNLSKTQINYLLDAPRVTKTQTINLVGVNTSGTIDFSMSGRRYYVSANSTDSTSYSYIQDLGNGRYRQTTLTDAFGKANIDPHNIFVQESNDAKQPKLVVSTESFKSDKVAEMYAHREPTGEDESKLDHGVVTTYTFYVPKGTVKQSSSIK